MPLKKTGKKILLQMKKEYGSKKGTRIFYSKENADSGFARLIRGGK